MMAYSRVRRSLALALWFIPGLMLLPLPAAQALDKPSNIACSNDENKPVSNVRITWGDTSTDETSYRVERSVDSGTYTEIASVVADTKEYVDPGLAANKVYRYRVRAHRDTDNTFGPYSDACRRPQTFDSTNFRVYYRPYPVADCPPINGRQVCTPAATNASGQNEMAARVSGLLEDSRGSYIELGFNDVAYYGNGKPLPVNIIWCDGGGCAGADTFGDGRKGGIGLAPELLGAYDPVTGIGDPTSVAVTMHELFHQQQYTYGGLGTDPDGNWAWEGQARCVQDKVCVGTDRSTCISLDSVTGGNNYFGQINNYLGDTNRGIPNLSYTAALFWTYLTEQYGTLNQEPELGMDLMVRFWEQGEANRNDDGIGTLNRTLQAMGHTERYRDIFKDFAVANYAKDLTGASVPARYRYVDETQPPGSYNAVTLDLDQALAIGDQIGPVTDGVVAWGVRYYQVRPDAAVPTLNVEFRQDSTSDVYYSLLAIKGDDIAREINHTGRDFVQTLNNDAYDKVVVIVAGLDNLANFRYSFNATQPVLNIVDPLQVRQASAGDPAAPEKILVKVEVLSAGSGAPVAGIDTGDFQITIGSTVVSAGQRISDAYVQGQYWLLLRAPTQTATGNYDLNVTYNTLSDTENLAVNYAARADADNALVIDRSGSMNIAGKMTAAQGAARLYVDSWRTGDKIGVVSYSSSATVDLSLRDWNTTSRDDAITAINALTAGGLTSIGDGLNTGMQELIDRGDSAHDWVMILLSDGLNTVNPPPQDFLTAYKARQDAGSKVPRVHTVALGPDADRTTMERIADQTGGSYHYSSEPPPAAALAATVAPAAVDLESLPNELAEIYRVIGETVVGQQQILADRGSFTVGAPVEHIIPVDGAAQEALIVFNWTPSLLSAEVTLTNPDGVSAGPPTLSDSTHFVWRIPTPQAGDWVLSVEREFACEFCAELYLVEASLRSDLTMEAFLGLAPEARLAGRPMPVLASLSDNARIPGAAVSASIIDPAQLSHVLNLYDDGLHGDGAANDGFYGNTFYQTYQGGSYVAVVSAQGSAATGSFQRRLRASFNMREAPDTDGDLLPDWWEILWGTDPDTPDAAEDHDNDGLITLIEWERGTNPLDPDTDDGGESDGSETGDPHDPTDDRIAQPRARAWPGVGRIWLRHTVEPDYNWMNAYRATAPDGVFALLASGIAPTGEWIDLPVSNDQEYCYRVSASGTQGQTSALSNITCTTPRLDPIAPTGWVRINDGAAYTLMNDVMLSLFAVDNPDEMESKGPGSPPYPIDEALSSGVAEMMIANNSRFTGAAWEPYDTSRPWTLEPEGEHATVYVKYKDAAGNVSEIFHSTIRVIDAVPAALDINPGSCPNPLNLKKKTLPVAIPGTADFDVTQIDVDSIRLAGVAPLRSSLEDVATPFEPFLGKVLAGDCTTEDGDGYTDLTLKFDVRQLLPALGPVTDREVKVLQLLGNLMDGTVFAGEDVVIILHAD